MSTENGSRDAGGASIAMTVIQEVAEAEGVGPRELPPLQESIDADALERLFSRTSTDDEPAVIEVTFRYCGYTVSVTSDGAVEVVPG